MSDPARVCSAKWSAGARPVESPALGPVGPRGVNQTTPAYRLALVSPPVALAIDVFARSVAEIGRADDEDLKALRPGLVASPRTGRDAHRVPFLVLDDLVVDLHPAAPAQDHVHLLLPLVRVAVRKAIAGRDALVAQAGFLELERPGRHAELQVRRAVEPGPDVLQVLLEVPESERHGAILWRDVDGGAFQSQVVGATRTTPGIGAGLGPARSERTRCRHGYRAYPKPVAPPARPDRLLQWEAIAGDPLLQGCCVSRIAKSCSPIGLSTPCMGMRHLFAVGGALRVRSCERLGLDQRRVRVFTPGGPPRLGRGASVDRVGTRSAECGRWRVC